MAYNSGDIIVLQNNGLVWEEKALPDSSTSTKGILKLATYGEINAGTDNTKAITPYALAQSGVSLKVLHFSMTGSLVVTDGLTYWRIPHVFDGWFVKGIEACLLVPNIHITEKVTLQLARGRKPGATSVHTWNDVLSTRLTIDKDEYDSLDAATQPVIDSSYDDLLEGDLLRLDCDVIGIGASGLIVDVIIGNTANS
jgi:hypothetical protein